MHANSTFLSSPGSTPDLHIVSNTNEYRCLNNDHQKLKCIISRDLQLKTKAWKKSNV